MALDASFKDLKRCISSALIDTTRTVSQISNEDLAFHCSSNPSVVPLLKQQELRLLELAHRLIRSAVSRTEVPRPSFSDADSVEDKWTEIVDVADDLLEKADAYLDEYSGVVRRSTLTQEALLKEVSSSSGKQRHGKVPRAQKIPKPQLLFDSVPNNNNEKIPFKPLLRTKPNAIITLNESLEVVAAEDGSAQYVQREFCLRNILHPFCKAKLTTIQIQSSI